MARPLHEDSTGMEQGRGFETAIETHLATCLGKLNEKARRLVQGYYHEGHSPETLSQREDRSVEAIYKTIQRARRELQVCIERQLAKELA